MQKSAQNNEAKNVYRNEQKAGTNRHSDWWRRVGRDDLMLELMDDLCNLIPKGEAPNDGTVEAENETLF